MTVERILCIDPGSQSGWCLYEYDRQLRQKRFLEYGLCGGNPDINMVNMNAVVMAAVPSILVIENQFINKPAKGFLGLVASRCAWEILFRLSSSDGHILRIDPATWQAVFGLQLDKKVTSAYKRKKLRKQQMCKLARTLLQSEFSQKQPDEVPENASDAVLMGLYIFQFSFEELKDFWI